MNVRLLHEVNSLPDPASSSFEAYQATRSCAASWRCSRCRSRSRGPTPRLPPSPPSLDPLDERGGEAMRPLPRLIMHGQLGGNLKYTAGGGAATWSVNQVTLSEGLVRRRPRVGRYMKRRRERAGSGASQCVL